MKKSILFSLAIFILTVLFAVGACAVECAEFEGGNISGQNYVVWASPVRSHLSFTDDQRLMRVQYLPTNGRVLIEYYDTDYNLLSRKFIDKELPLYGGIYIEKDAFYILTGQNNPDENDSTEVFRITKYDKNWNRVSSAGLFGANTTVPFDAGSARFAKSGKYLIIRTSHEMYKYTDGINHQANVTIQLDTEKMQITDSYTDIMNTRYGYVSHSFNQFVKVEDDRIVALDHGDANPRSIVLIKYKTKVSSGKFVPSYYNTCEAVDMFPIAGTKGDNYTYCSVGGFETSSSSYLAAVSSVEQGNNSGVRNIYVSVLDKSSAVPTVKKLTDYTDAKTLPSTPHLVKTGSDSFVVLWEKGAEVYCAQLDGKANLVSKIYSFKGDLSDCVPIICGGKLIWYVWNENEVSFYEMTVENPEEINKITLNTYHDYRIMDASGSSVNLLCTKCGAENKGSVPSDFSIWWEISGEDGYYSSIPENKYHPGDETSLWVRYTQADYNEYEVLSSDPDIVTISCDINGNPTALMAGEGTAKITVKSKYSADIKQTYTVKVAHSWKESKTDPTCTQSGKSVRVCSECGESITQIISALGHDMSDYEIIKEPTCTAQGKKVSACSRCGEEENETIAKIAHDKSVTIKAVAATCTKSGKTPGRKCSMCGKVTAEQETIPALGHDMSDYEITKEPTCTAQGKKVSACSRCGEEESQAIAKIAHDKSVTIKAVAATCTKSGKTAGRKCSMCGKVTAEQETIPALGHDMSDYEIIKEPTCTAQGKKVSACSRCGEEESQAIAKIAHDKSVTIKAVAATCTKSGKTVGRKCSMCGKVTAEQETVPALGHDMSDYEITKEPTCTAQGKKVSACSRCGEEESEAIAKIAHDKSVTIKAVAATCTKSGKTAGRKCSMCGKVTVEQEAIPALGHDMGDYEITKKPTCTAQGEKAAVCKRCNKKETLSTAKLGHSYNDYVVTKEPTCTAMGEKTAYCSRCNQTVSDSIDRTPHRETVMAKIEPTCTKTGKTQGIKCARCGSVLKAQETVAKLGHNMKTTVITKATKENHGQVSQKCIRCSKSDNLKVYRISSVSLSAEKFIYDGKVKSPSVKVVDSQKNALRQGEDYTVSYQSGRKAVGKYLVKVTFKGKYSGSEKLYFTVIPGKTAKINVSSSTSAVKLTWSKVSGAAGYRVLMYNTKTKAYDKVITTAKNTCTVKNLKAGTSCKFAVKAYKKDAEGTVYWGGGVTVLTATKPLTPAACVQSAQKKTAVISWNKVSGATGYQIYYSTAKDGKYTKLSNATALSYKKTGLKSGKTYYFKVRAYKKVGTGYVYSSFSSVKSVKIK